MLGRALKQLGGIVKFYRFDETYLLHAFPMQVDYVPYLGRDSISSLLLADNHDSHECPWNKTDKSLKSQTGLVLFDSRNVEKYLNFYFNLFITRLYERIHTLFIDKKKKFLR